MTRRSWRHAAATMVAVGAAYMISASPASAVGPLPGWQALPAAPLSRVQYWGGYDDGYRRPSYRSYGYESGPYGRGYDPYGYPPPRDYYRDRREAQKDYWKAQKDAQKEYWKAQREYQKKLIKRQLGRD